MGYGDKEHPVPWLGPQAWIKEVHWPSNKTINVRIPLVATANNSVVTTGTCTATVVNPSLPSGAGNGYILKSLLHYQPPSGWPTVGSVDTDPGLGISIPDSWYPPPRIMDGRTVSKGSESPDEGTDAIRENEVTASGLPNYPVNGGRIEHAAWAIFTHGFTVDEPLGAFVDYRPRNVTNPSTRFRKGTNFNVQVWAKKYTGSPQCYGGFVGDPTGVIAAPFLPELPWAYWSNAGQIPVDFSEATFTYKKRKYKPVARYIEGPYDKAKTTEPRYGFTFQLLCEVQREPKPTPTP